jgi:hypothetical protein
MLAQVFKPTESKKNAPNRRQASVPARRSALASTAAPVVLLATRPSYGEAPRMVNDTYYVAT